MEAVFLKLVNMSITAGWLVFVVLLLRLLLKKAPKAIHCALWALVALRLLLPFSLESVFSLIPSTEPLPEEFLYAAAPQLNTGITSVDQALNPMIAESLTPSELTSVNPTQIYSFIFSQIWILGMILMFLYALISYLVIRRKVRISIRIDNTIRLCDHIGSPFILGIIRPQIYLPSDLNPETAALVLAHEQAHLKRRDHWWKPLGFALLSVYWFNPVLWLAYILLCRDIELACDEKVVKDFDPVSKKAYSMALLECSIPRRMITACPLAFGEGNVKRRIKSVLHYKKPAFWIVAVSVAACIIAAVCFLTDPATEADKWEERCRDVLEDIQSMDTYHITVSGQYEGEDFLNDTSTTQYYKHGDTLLSVCHIPADGSTSGSLKHGETYYESVTYDGSLIWEESANLEISALIPRLVSIQYNTTSLEAIARNDMEDCYYIRLRINEPFDESTPNNDYYHVDFFFDHADNFLYAVLTAHKNPLSNPHTVTMTMAVSDIREAEIREALAQMTRMDYRMAPGTYVPISSDSETSLLYDPLALTQTFAYEVTENSFIIHDLKSGNSTRYSVDWRWKGYEEAEKNIPLFEINRLTQPFGVLKPVLDNPAWKYQYISDDYHLLTQDGALCLLIADRAAANTSPVWRVHFLVSDHPQLLAPKSFPEALERIHEINAATAFNRSGNCRPGTFDMTEAEVDTLRRILSEMPQSAFTLQNSMPDIYNYYIGISGKKDTSNSIRFNFNIYYDYAHILLVWYDQYTQKLETFEISYAPLQAFLESMMQPERIDNYAIILDIDNPTYISYTHKDVTIQLVRVAGWEYEIVAYVNDHTDFGIRCKPEWLEDWLFFGYAQVEVTPESKFLHEVTIPDSMLGTNWHYLFEDTSQKETFWREWPRPWKMIYRYHNGGTYYIYNEGAFDERLVEHDRGGYQFIEASFAQGLSK